MDFSWVSDMNLHKYNSHLPNASGQEPPALSRRAPQDTSHERLFNHSPLVGTTGSHVSNLAGGLRRPRAGTMPSRTTMLPYTVPSTTTATNNSVSSSQVMSTGDALYLDGGTTLNLGASSGDVGRRRSGSVTLLSASNMNTSPQEYEKALLNSGIPSYYTNEENASDTVQRTLASLGLEDTRHSAPYLPMAHTDGQKQSQQRHRAYTVSTRDPSSSGDRLGEMMPPLGFSPFSPQTRSNVMQRPRAVSLGMADLDDNGFSSFAPFGRTSPSNNRPNPAIQAQHQHGFQQQQKELPPLGHQISPDTQQSLRMSRSSGNMMDLTSERYWATSRFGTVDNYEDGSLDDLPHQDAKTSVSSSSSALLDSPSSAPSQIPSRTLWLGNINPSLNVNDLMQQFSIYGHVESARILSDKECAFVNFTTVEDAVAAKNDLESRLGSKLGGTLVRVGFGKADVTVAMALTNEAGPNAQGPTRALWVGNIPSNINIAILQAIFQAFGPIESVRVLSHKNCGFVNFVHQEDAVRARKNLQNKEILGPGSGTVRIGFAKAPSAEDINNGEPGCVSVPSQQQAIPPTQYQMYQQQHHGYLQQQQRYHQYITSTNTKDQQPFPPNLSPRHNAPVSSSSTSRASNDPSNSLSTDACQATQWATAMMMTTLMTNASGKHTAGQPNLNSAISTERQFIMQQLCPSTDATPHDRAPVSYFSVIPPVPELGTDRTLEPLRLRDMRKRLENGQALQDVEMMAQECMDEIVELCSDYIGNTVVQKLFEYCTESTKLIMLERIAPHLAAIGVHKNGTWAAQKIIDYANTPAQTETIQRHVAPYVPLLLLDQFGNYVVQCCLRKGPHHNQYIFDAIVDKCWEIGQGRFGARAVRSILENDVVAKNQRIYCAAAIVQNAVLLTTNANGTLLLVWLLDTSELSGRYRVLTPRLLPYLNKLCIHKSGSMTVFKIIQQQEEPDTSRLFLQALTTDAHILDDVLRDQTHGVVLMQKIIGLPHISNDQRVELVQLIRASLDRIGAQQFQAYKKLMEDLDLVGGPLSERNDDGITIQQQQVKSSTPPPSIPSHQPSVGSSNGEAPMDMVSWMKNPQAVAMMANMYAAAMTAAATSQQQMTPTATIPDLPPFNHILKSILSSSSPSSSPASTLPTSKSTPNQTNIPTTTSSN
ncbi:hypothetical protein BC941DRAFT_403933 [Chlamydoabsidia padenii]|nr:hypothetical protein BC941DRAFT_403933 [Chlamydoabsidia padenii]